MNWTEKIAEIDQKRKVIEAGGGAAAIDKQHRLGKLTARERIGKLLDPGSFLELEPWYEPTRTGFDIDKQDIPGDAVVCGSGTINGRPAYVSAQDFTTMEGTMATIHAAKITLAMEQALRLRVPFISMMDSAGVRLEDALVGRQFYSASSIMYTQTQMSGVVPQIALIMGPCTGEMACSTALADFTFMVEGTSYMHLISPSSEADRQRLEDVKLHSRWSGCCDVVVKNDEDCINRCKELLSLLPANNKEKPPVIPTTDDPQRRIPDLLDVVPAEASKTYDMHKVIRLIVDNGYFFEMKAEFSRSMMVGFARMDGQVVGIVANNPAVLAGAIPFDAADKEARFIRFCDAFGIPLIYLADTPAFLPGIDQEQAGILRHGSKVVHANAEATVPKLTLYVRKAYGGGVLAMCPRWLGHDIGLAWPTVEFGLMGAKELSAIVFAREIKSAKDPEAEHEKRAAQLEILLAKLSHQGAFNLTDIIDPRNSRAELVKALKLTESKIDERPVKKHECIPL